MINTHDSSVFRNLTVEVNLQFCFKLYNTTTYYYPISLEESWWRCTRELLASCPIRVIKPEGKKRANLEWDGQIVGTKKLKSLVDGNGTKQEWVEKVCLAVEDSHRVVATVNEWINSNASIITIIYSRLSKLMTGKMCMDDEEKRTINYFDLTYTM